MMKRILLIVLLLGCAGMGLRAQVKIGGLPANPNPNVNAMFEVESTTKGFLLPRLVLTSSTSFAPLAAHVAGMIVYNTATANDVRPGLYQNDGTKWVKLIGENNVATKFFYMPSIVFDTSVLADGLKRNLYLEYKAQFSNQEFLLDPTGGSIGSSPRPTFVKSTNAPAVIPTLTAATDLYYYVTDYDASALGGLSIDENGILTYDVIGTGTDYSFVNVVFVIR